MKNDVLLDADIREPLFDYFEQCYGKVRFLEEKVTGKARADVVMVLPDKDILRKQISEELFEREYTF